MEQTESATHICKLDPRYGEFAVYRKKPPLVHESRFENGVLTITATPLDQHPTLSPMARYALFRANYAGDRHYNVDLDCGAQRWNGTQTSAAVSKALRKCGFDSIQVKSILAMARKQTNDSVTRNW
jgi:hypothetical protein